MPPPRPCSRPLRSPAIRRRAGALTGVLALAALGLAACEPGAETEEAPVSLVHRVANGCFAVAAMDPGANSPRLLTVAGTGASFDFVSFDAHDAARATSFFLKPSRLGTYLFFDDTQGFLVAEGRSLERREELLSDVLLGNDTFESPAEWVLEATIRPPLQRWRLRHRASGRFLTTAGLVDAPEAAAAVFFFPARGCATFPEASLDATGGVGKTRFDDGTLYGFVDTHSHILSNFAFGGGGIFHGAPFHPLGVEHALSDCTLYHGEEGRRDLFGFGFDNQDAPLTDLLNAFLAGQTPEPNHATDGWPTFTDWPDAHASSTHQVQYYRWLERAYLGGMRLVVLHATSNQIICDFIVGLGIQPVRYSCNDMVAVDRILAEAYAMEAYIDAQEGGPGRGWLRIVTSPEEARQVIGRGKLAVVLGIETSNLFDCFLVPSEEFPRCTAEDVVERLDRYHGLGVRAIFPVHKFDNAFSAGDGQKGFIELGNVAQTGHFSNFTPACDPDVPSVFDKGPASFPGLIEPREDFLAPPPTDVSGFAEDPFGTLFPLLGRLLEEGGDSGEVCQAAGLTELGERLIREMMQRGMIVELDHMPRRSYARAFEILEQHDYPAAGTHGLNNLGRLYRLGGVSKTGLGRCQSPTESATMDDRLQARIRLIESNGGFPAEGFGFDLNGFAGAPGPRFGPESVCNTPQANPVTYPFRSVAGDVTFHRPRVGERVLDFNTEGLVHIGLVPELIEDVRRDGVSDAELEPLFRSAEGYLRMWEKAERRAATLR